MKKSVVLVLLFAFLIRLVFSIKIHPIGNYIFSDPQTYWNLSKDIFTNNNDLSNVFYPPGYPLLIGLIRGLVGDSHVFIWIGVIQSILGVLTIYFVYKISQLVLDKKKSLFLLFLLAIYYPLIDYTGYLMSETLATSLLSLTLYCLLVKKNYSLSVLGIILANLVRPNLSITLVPLLLTLSRGKNLVQKAISIVLVLLISGVINLSFSGKFTPTSLNGGFVFMAGQCLVGHSYDSTGSSFGPPVYMQRDLHMTRLFPVPFTDSEYFYREGVQCLVDNPRRIVEKIWEVSYLFLNNISWPSSQFYPFSKYMEISHQFFYLFVFSGLTVYWWNRRQGKKSKYTKALWWVILSSLLTAYVYYADIRYRLPYDPYFLLLALVGFSKFQARIDKV